MQGQHRHDLKLFFGFLTERSLGWRELSPAELGEFVRSHPGTLAIPSHDRELWSQLGPEYP
ncbi:MAG: hypothetical protein ACRDPC_06555 [Solirubrobacteraceae bacterium]